MFPSLCCFALLIALGLRSLVLSPRLVILLAVGFFVVNTTVVATVIYPVYWTPEMEGIWTDVSVSLTKGIVPAGPLMPGREVKQSFVATQDHMCKLSVWIANYAGHLTAGQLKFRLVSGTDSTAVLASKDLPVRHQPDNIWIDFPFPEIKNSRGHMYSVILSAEGLPPGQMLTPWLTTAKTYQEGSLWIGGQPQPRDLVLRTYFRLPE